MALAKSKCSPTEWNDLLPAEQTERICYVIWRWRKAQEWHLHLVEKKMNYVEAVTAIKLAEFGVFG